MTNKITNNLLKNPLHCEDQTSKRLHLTKSISPVVFSGPPLGISSSLKGRARKITEPGQVVIALSNRDVLIGSLKNGALSGPGKIEYANGDVYRGLFKNGVISSYGKMIFKNGDIYQGDFSNEKISGKGVLTLEDGITYEGDFLDGLMSGKGKLTYPSGTVLKGDFLKDLPKSGTLTFTNGNFFEGEFLPPPALGNGRFTFASGTIIEGHFDDHHIYGTKTYFDPKIQGVVEERFENNAHGINFRKPISPGLSDDES